jgi:hypothetical protein
MNHPRVKNKRKVSNTANCVYVGRPSKWGNPFRSGIDGSKDEVIAKYEEWIQENTFLLLSLGELKGKTLLCWCDPRPCHANVLANLVDALYP